jgi:hypothetical protein
MSEHDDFASLYRELGIRGACTPEAFRHAYRRRVSQLHPDQRGHADDVATLQELNRLYDAALDFLRAHGRLPGSAASVPQQAHAIAQAHSPALHAAQADAGAGGDGSLRDEPAAGTQRLSRYFVLLAVLAIAALAASALKGTISVHQDTPHDTGAAALHRPPGGESGLIALGMGKRRVRSIQGEPVGDHDIRWDYGPSWIDFKCGDVVSDWYSSPLRPLKVETPHPSAADWDRHDAAPPPGC